MSLVASQTKRLVALHGWLGLLVSLFLYTVVLTGTIAVLAHEIDHWTAQAPDREDVFDEKIHRHIERLAQQVPAELHKFVQTAPTEEGMLWVFFGAPKPNASGQNEAFGRSYVIHPKNGRIISATAGFISQISLDDDKRALHDFLVNLHVRLHVPGSLGLYLTGLLGVVLLISIISGVLIHRNIIRDLFVTTRPGQKPVSYRDTHNLSAVWSLPFAFVLSFSGAFLSLVGPLGLPVVAMVAFEGDQNAALETLLGEPKVENAAPVPLSDLDKMISDANTRAGTTPMSIEITDYGRADARIEFAHPARLGDLRTVSLLFDGASGAFLKQAFIVGPKDSAGTGLIELLVPLHFGNFAGFVSKFIWVALGATMTVTIVTGCQLWFKRREEDYHWQWFGAWFTYCAWGLPLALVMSAYGFFLSRLASDPTIWTPRGFIIGLLFVLFWGIKFGVKHKQQGQVELIKLLGLSLLVLPLIRLQTGGLSWGEAAFHTGTDLIIVELLCLIFGGWCILLARRSNAIVAQVSTIV